ncbi:phenazine biosynthesis protein PhzF [Edaphobacter acidisoli]|uniref:Phenazine biosynthesis protein PhzF n=1 Tax=Edaphobacter acidisoli TaxID=2040573 RepID=A0A916S031_9BACT|nr:PhzF family phenazine biosynthesis protein [Edaphobacter acidisoli]GGA78338.1 phenazine biosynthesis protein PhzF [Edaphobacter acidisoli]
MSNTPAAPRKAHQAYDYSLVDVFAEQPLAGNQLAIFSDARGLTTEEMQSLARETNLSETTFILPRDTATEREHGVQVRIFTVAEELRFAGHPTLGTASWLHWNHPTLASASEITLDLPIGPIAVRFTPSGLDDFGIFGTMQQNNPIFGEVHDRVALAKALGLSIDDLDPNLPAQTVSTGMPFCIVPLRSLEVAARLAIPQHTASTYLERRDAKFFHCVTRAATQSGADWHARMQFYNGEDPATGSASGCFISWLVQHKLAATGQQVIIEQGVEMRRPSRIHASATREGDKVTKVFVGGRTIPVANGRFFLP